MHPMDTQKFRGAAAVAADWHTAFVYAGGSFDEPLAVTTDELRKAATENASVEVGVLAAIRNAAKDDWRAGAWFLEHRWPERYGSQRSAAMLFTAFSTTRDRVERFFEPNESYRGDMVVRSVCHILSSFLAETPYATLHSPDQTAYSPPNEGDASQASEVEG